MNNPPKTPAGRQRMARTRSILTNEWRRVRDIAVLDADRKRISKLAKDEPTLVEVEKRGKHLWARSLENPVPTYREALLEYESNPNEKD